MVASLKAPFPAFGGKSKVASIVWERLGDVDNAIEPFANSAAWLLARPHAPKIETLNDWDCYVANFWRATKHEPELLAEYADNPVNEADLHARHRWLVLGEHAKEFRNKMRSDPHYYSCEVAGYWVWGACCWIGSGWCCEPKGHELSEQLPHMDEGRGVTLCQKRPDAENRGVLSCGNRPQLADAFSLGRGVCGSVPDNRRPIISNSGSGGHEVHTYGGMGTTGTVEQRRAWLCEWFNRLRDRLRNVRVCCGDWIRVCNSHSTTTRLGLTGVFLDPPYRTKLADGKSNRTKEIYASDRDSDVNALVDRVQAWCKEHGSDPMMRIGVCGYESEGYETLEELGWTVESWKASGGYGNQSGKVNDNAGRERIWFSPHCLIRKQQSLF